MTHDYCPATIAGAPAHTCLCYHQPNHHGGHECRCGHYWLCTRDGSVVTWDDMTYDQQWKFLGLPEVPWAVPHAALQRQILIDAPNVTMDDLRVTILGLIKTDSEFATGQLNEEEPPYAGDTQIVGKRVAYVDEAGTVRDAGIVTEIQSVNDEVVVTCQKHPEEDRDDRTP